MRCGVYATGSNFLVSEVALLGYTNGNVPVSIASQKGFATPFTNLAIPEGIA
jgi:hypothetical protein